MHIYLAKKEDAVVEPVLDELRRLVAGDAPEEPHGYRGVRWHRAGLVSEPLPPGSDKAGAREESDRLNGTEGTGATGRYRKTLLSPDTTKGGSLEPPFPFCITQPSERCRSAFRSESRT